MLSTPCNQAQTRGSAMNISCKQRLCSTQIFTGHTHVTKILVVLAHHVHSVTTTCLLVQAGCKCIHFMQPSWPRNEHSLTSQSLFNSDLHRSHACNEDPSSFGAPRALSYYHLLFVHVGCKCVIHSMQPSLASRQTYFDKSKSVQFRSSSVTRM